MIYFRKNSFTEWPFFQFSDTKSVCWKNAQVSRKFLFKNIQKVFSLTQNCLKLLNLKIYWCLLYIELVSTCMEEKIVTHFLLNIVQNPPLYGMHGIAAHLAKLAKRPKKETRLKPIPWRQAEALS
jgi:hypothetical protein